jgi:pectin methylesterase-like acyl-CoA thioesterase
MVATERRHRHLEYLGAPTLAFGGDDSSVGRVALPADRSAACPGLTLRACAAPRADCAANQLEVASTYNRPVAETLSATHLSSNTRASGDLLDWLTSIGVIHPRSPERYTRDVARVKMIVSLINAGFTLEKVEATVSHAGLNLDHVDPYDLRRPGERSRRAFAQSPRL